MVSTKATLLYLTQRLHERSTYLMVPILMSLYGVQADDATVQMISSFGISISGLLLILLPESTAQRTLSLTQYLLARLKEPTSLAAIPVLLGALGIHVSNPLVHQISVMLIGLGGVVAALLGEAGVVVPAVNVDGSPVDPVAIQSPPPSAPPVTTAG